MIGLGILALVYGDFAMVWQPVAPWIPGRTALAYGYDGNEPGGKATFRTAGTRPLSSGPQVPVDPKQKHSVAATHR